MSQTETLLTFQAASAPALPRLVCVGSVTEVGEGHVSRSQKYVVQPIKIAPEGTGRGITYNLLYRPEWMRPGFDPKNLTADISEDDAEAMAEAKSMESVYRRHIHVRNGISALRGMSGSDEAFATLSNRLLTLEEVSIPAVQEVLHTFFTEDNEGVLFGYVLKQQQSKTDEIDPDTGRNVYVPENRYEVDHFFDFSEKALRSYQKRAEKSKSGLIVTYDPSMGF